MQNVDTPLNEQVGGAHYRTGGIQPVEYIEANGLGFLEGCVIKRLTRHNRVGGKGVQDIDKAIHELRLLKELRYASQEKDCPPSPTVPVTKEWDADRAWWHSVYETFGEGNNVHK